MGGNDVLEQMDMAAREAAKELDALDREAVNKVAQWWRKWFLKAGHKRLGRLLIQRAKEQQGE